ncbi:MAG TPA: hypothetical protein VGK19_03170 [Capsulimonadaceae bacterium]|jgi:xylan 1,4-beta-xylosidase
MSESSKLSRRDVLAAMAAGIVAMQVGSAAAADATAAAPSLKTVSLGIDASKPLADLRPIWRFFGCDNPTYLTTPHGKALLGELGDMSRGNVYFRAHNLLCTHDGKNSGKWGTTNAYTEDANGSPVYDWSTVDAIFDAGLKRGVKPYVQLGFMPKALSSKPEPYGLPWFPGVKYEDLFGGWAHPPKDYSKWAELVYQWVKHCLARYGEAEVLTWYWEAWNEPNIDFWQGSREEFFKLYDYSVDAVKRVLPKARVGGPETAIGAGGTFLHDFLEHCTRGKNYATGKIGSPLDFVSFHAKGSPSYVTDHVRMGIASELKDTAGAFDVIASFPEYARLPIVIGEADPDGCAACKGERYGYRDGPLYASFTAASFARIHELAEKRNMNLEGAITWSFEFENEPLFPGLRQLSSNGIDLPILNTLRMFSMMAGKRLAVSAPAQSALAEVAANGVRGEADVSALASIDKKRIYVLAWHYHDDDVPGPSIAANITVDGVPWQASKVRATQYLIDTDHSNAFAVWKAMGSPAAPDDRQTAKLHDSAKLHTTHLSDLPLRNGSICLNLTLVRQSVSLVVLERA